MDGDPKRIQMALSGYKSLLQRSDHPHLSSVRVVNKQPFYGVVICEHKLASSVNDEELCNMNKLGR